MKRKTEKGNRSKEKDRKGLEKDSLTDRLRQKRVRRVKRKSLTQTQKGNKKGDDKDRWRQKRVSRVKRKAA